MKRYYFLTPEKRPFYVRWDKRPSMAEDTYQTYEWNSVHNEWVAAGPIPWRALANCRFVGRSD